MQSLFSQQTRWIVATFVSGFLMTASATGVFAGDFGPREDVAGLVETLVASNDLKPAPSVISVARPMVGSLVGARPLMPWSRSSASR